MGKKSKGKGKKGKSPSPKPSSSSKKKTQEHQEEEEHTPRITMEDLEEMSGSEGGLGSEDEWDDEAKSLKDAILSGKFDHLLEREDGGGENDDDNESIEEVELGDEYDGDDKSDEDDDEENPQVEEEENEEADKAAVDSSASDEEEEKGEGSAGEEEEEKVDEKKNSEEDSDEDEVEQSVEQSIEQKNNLNSKALHVVTQQLVGEKQSLPWAETFQVVPPTPLPFGASAEGSAALDIHDDLKREVAFYDLALEAVHKGREECKKAEIQFTRPEDFFAEMVKTDDHMARVKDRLIFETKKIEAVAQRRSNKEQKLRSKEAHANKIAEKAKRKRDHFKEVEEWANSAASQREDGGQGRNKKRAYADKKFGFGGKRGRFKQNDHKTMNDMSGYNPSGNFQGGMKINAKTASGSSGGKRKGKRARDASRRR